MKFKQALVIGCAAVLFSSAGFSWWSKYDSCSNDADGDPNYCNSCQCNDNNYGQNTCMSLSEYCEAFGNVGGR